NRREAAAELQVRAGTVNHVGLLARESRNAVRVDPHAVRQGGARTGNPDRVEVRDLVVPRFPLYRVELRERLGRVGVDDGAGFLGEIAHRAEQRPGAAGREAWGEAVAQPATRRPMPAR